MADNEKYFIRLHGKEIEVSEDVYYAYFQMARQERTQDEKLQRNHVVSYDAMDTARRRKRKEYQCGLPDRLAQI